jgi:predicted Rossmann fold flavoprotein
VASVVDVVVVGAGAAGLMAAIAASGAGASVFLLESTRDGGRKILISGGGRCNVLPETLAPERFVTDSSPHIVRNLLRSWPLDAQRAFFERELSIPLKLEPETGKWFPVSDRARDVRDGLVAMARARGVDLQFGSPVTGLSIHVSGHWVLRVAGGETVPARAVVLATGGLSVPATGSDGFGLDVARGIGHTIHATYPALTPLVADPPVHAMLAGVSLVVRIGVPGTRPMHARGGFLFTHRGYSGPVVLDVSHRAVRARASGQPQPLLVRWAALDERAWHEDLRPGEGLVVSRVRAHLPQRLADCLVAESRIGLDRPLAALHRDERIALVERLCATRCPGPGMKAFARPRSRAVAWRSASSIRARSRAGVVGGCFSAVRCSTRSGRSAATTSRGPGPRDASPGAAPHGRFAPHADPLRAGGIVRPTTAAAPALAVSACS